MYLEHFGLGVNPFSLSPKLDFLYKSGTFEESMAHLVYGLDNQEAIVLITGAIGTGKTMALQSFLTNLGPRFEFALITNTRVTANELLKLVLEDLGVGLPIGADKSDLLILFKDYLQGASQQGKMVLIVVDEAQNLAPEVLEEIRLLTNLGQGEIQPVQIILVGQPELEETVNRPDLAQIRQRIRVHYNLDPLSRPETEEYLTHRMSVAGCRRKVFTSGAVDRIYQVSRGVPRLVNTMAGEALLSAFVAGHEMVQPGDIEEDQDLRFATGPAPAPVPTPVIPQAAPPVPPTPVVPHVTAPVPPPAPQAQPQPVPPVQPPAPRVQPPAPPVQPLPTPQVQPQPEPAPPPPVVPPRRASARRRSWSRSGKGKTLRTWILVALLFAFLGTLYYMGSLDGLVAALIPSTEQGPVRNPVTEPVVTGGQPLEEATRPADADPQITQVDDAGEQEAEQGDDPLGGREDDQEEGREGAQQDNQVNPPVRSTESVPTETAAPVQVAAPPAQGDYYLHIYSFRTPDRADSYVRHWDHPEYGITFRTKEVRGVNWHRIYLGPFVTRDTALVEALRLQQEGVIQYYKVSTLPLGQDS